MAEELGKIEKPEIESYTNKKKLYLVPLVYTGENSPPEYVELYELYWKQVDEHLNNLESRMGAITRIYHESLTVGSESDVKILEKLNAKSYLLVKGRMREGVSLDVIEDKSLVEECVDWERCLTMGLISESVMRKIYDYFIDATKKRYEHITKRITETLKPGEQALLLIREGHMVQFPPDIDVFHVSPPALNELHRWLRDHKSMEKEEQPEKK